jgi:tetratricopeptide (TPR) repeat protein
MIDAAIVALVEGSVAAVATAAICGLLGATAKETTAAAPLVVLAFDLAWHGLPWRRAEGGVPPGRPRPGLRAWLYAALAVNWLAAGLLAALLGGRGGSAGLSSAAVWPYFLSQCRGAWLYLERLCWPATLVLDYGERPLGSLGELWPFLVATGATAAVICGGFCLAPRRWCLPLAALILLSPSSSVVPVATQILAEHRAYLPAGFVTAAAAALVSWLVATRRQALIAGVAVSIVAGLFMARTHARNRDFATPERLWRRNLADCPANPRPLTSLAAALIRAGAIDEAEAVVAAALAAEPEKFLNWVNCGRVRAARGDDAAAIAAFTRAADLAAERIEPLVNRAIVRSRAGAFTAARADLDRAVSLRPDLAKAWLARGLVSLRAGDPERAVSDLARGLDLDPDSADGWTNLGAARLAVGDRERAAAAFGRALEIRPGQPQATAGLEAAIRPD